jgi:hypothetical protein
MNRILWQFTKGMWLGGTLGFTGSSAIIIHRGNVHSPPIDQKDLIEKYTIMGVSAGAITVCFRNWAPQTMFIASAAFIPNYLRLLQSDQ